MNEHSPDYLGSPRKTIDSPVGNSPGELHSGTVGDPSTTRGNLHQPVLTGT
jgi:hypothetical protein